MTVFHSERLVVRHVRHDLEDLHANWGWLVALGVALAALGVIALGSLAFATLASVIAIAILMIAGGVVEVIGAFSSRGWSGFFLHLIFGILLIVVGALFFRMPADAVASMTLLLACLLLAGGAFRIATALIYRFTTWGWELASGVIELVLGLLIWAQWPASSLWTIGLFVGIALIFSGVNWVALGMALRARGLSHHGLHADALA